MADRSVELASAIYATLIGNAPLVALVGTDGNGLAKVYDSPPPGLAAPYVVIGEETANDYPAQLSDGQEHALTIHVWTEQRSTLQVKQIMAAIRDALHDQDVVLTGGNLVNLRQDYKQILPDPDGVSQHGVLRYRAVTEN